MTVLDQRVVPLPHLIPIPAQPTNPSDRAAPERLAVPRPQIRRMRYEPPASSSDYQSSGPAPVATPITADLPREPDAYTAAQQLLRIIVEILNRRRPLAQLTKIADAPVVRCVRVAIPEHGVAQLQTLHISQPRTGAAEVAAVCRLDSRCRVIAARLDRRAAAWCCTALRLL